MYLVASVFMYAFCQHIKHDKKQLLFKKISFRTFVILEEVSSIWDVRLVHQGGVILRAKKEVCSVLECFQLYMLCKGTRRYLRYPSIQHPSSHIYPIASITHIIIRGHHKVFMSVSYVIMACHGTGAFHMM